MSLQSIRFFALLISFLYDPLTPLLPLLKFHIKKSCKRLFVFFDIKLND